MAHQQFAISVTSAVLSLPGSLHALLQLYKLGRHEEANRSNTLELSLEGRSREGEEQAARADNITQRERDILLGQFSRLKKLIAEGRNGQLTTMDPIAEQCEELEYALQETLARAARPVQAAEADKDKIAEIKAKMINGRPLQREYAHIYTNTEEPPRDITFANGCLVTFADELCFMEFFPFGEDHQRTKSRICWMMVLLAELKCPRLVQPVKVFASFEISDQQGFYTLSRVPFSQQGGQGPVQTLADCVSRVRNKKQVLLQLSRAVEDIHAETILHKNICADNVIVDEANCNTWLAGFSSSRLQDQGSHKIPKEEQERLKMVYCDTDYPAYHVWTFKCDIYALGVTMLEVLVGESFVKNTERIKSRDHIKGLLCSDEECKAGQLKKLICDCLHPEARRRPRASEINLQLEFIDPQEIDHFFHRAL